MQSKIPPSCGPSEPHSSVWLVCRLRHLAPQLSLAHCWQQQMLDVQSPDQSLQLPQQQMPSWQLPATMRESAKAEMASVLVFLFNLMDELVPLFVSAPRTWNFAALHEAMIGWISASSQVNVARCVTRRWLVVMLAGERSWTACWISGQGCMRACMTSHEV